MKRWWQQHARRVRLTFWFTAATDAVLCLMVAYTYQLRLWQATTQIHPLTLVVACSLPVTGFLAWLGYLITGWALEPVRESVDLARRLSANRGGQQITVTNPHDEIGELEIYLNELLARLEGSYVELDRFAADIAHELRTPLTAVRTVGEVALRQQNPTALHDAVGSMLEEVRRMNQMIERLLLLTRGDSDKWPVRPKPGAVRDVLLEVCETLGIVAEEKQQRLQVECSDDLKAIFDTALLRLALMNLGQNAIRYSPPGKTVRLRGASTNHEAIVEIIDEGPGIAPQHRDKIFQRFYRVDVARSRAEGGVGLGLAIVKWAVERMGGRVEMESRVGAGSTFRIRLTLAQR